MVDRNISAGRAHVFLFLFFFCPTVIIEPIAADVRGVQRGILITPTLLL